MGDAAPARLTAPHDRLRKASSGNAFIANRVGPRPIDVRFYWDGAICCILWRRLSEHNLVILLMGLGGCRGKLPLRDVGRHRSFLPIFFTHGPVEVMPDPVPWMLVQKIVAPINPKAGQVRLSQLLTPNFVKNSEKRGLLPEARRKVQ